VSAVPQLGERLVADRIRRAWAEVAGADVARRSTPHSLTNGVLVVHVDNSPWLHELTLRSDDLAARLVRRFPAVRVVRFMLGPPPAPTPTTAARPRPRPLSPAETGEIDAAVAVISDPEVSAAARRLLAKSRQLAKE
jgi:hypothetical protein